MAICYDKLWKLLIDKKMNRTELKEASGISFNVLARLGKNEPVSFESIEKIVQLIFYHIPQLATSNFLTISLDFLLHVSKPVCYLSCFLIIYSQQFRQKEGTYMSRDSATVSNNMRKIHSKDTSIELLLRKALWHKGYRYRKNYKALPGSHDIVLTKYKIAIFCDSEFFHGKDWEIKK